MRARRQEAAVFATAALTFAVLSIATPGPIAIHWNGADATGGATAPAWVIGITVLAVMSMTAWAYRGARAALPVLIAEAVFGVLFVIVVAASSNTAVLGALLLAALASVLSYIGAGKLVQASQSHSGD